MITIKLNNKEVKTDEGKTILEVANENGIEIPTLCHDSELKPFGSCWVCAVQVKGRKGFVTSCGTNVADGMEIITDSKEVHQARKMALELLLSDHYADCVAPCKLTCPDNVDVQTYVSHIANEQYHEAVKVIKENLPMPLSIGRVCPAFCEDECRRTLVDEPIAIRQLKRYAADFDLNNDWTWTPEKAKASGKKVAIVGGGPAGLTCGYYLSNNGHDVTVFEAAPEPGGWLRYGIPEYRLPKKILDKEIKLMCTNGMKIKTNTPVGEKITLSQLSDDYDAVFLALGAQKAVPMRAKGSNLEGCLLGVDFLKEHALGNKPKLGKKVAIIGGGNTAIDCARTAVRLGSEVTLAYRRTRKEMPAEDYEVDAAEEEGVKFYFLTNPVENFGNTKGQLTKIKFEKMKLGKPDDSGRRRPEPTGKFFEEKFDTVIAAISQRPDVDFLAEKENHIDGKEIPLTRWATAQADEYTMYLGMKNIFAGGDFRRGPATAIEAIADGRKAATAIDRYLKGKIMLDPVKVFNSVKEKKLADVDPTQYEQYEKENRLQMPELAAKKRATNFKEVELGFEKEEAPKEAKRCLECGCQVNETCDLRKFATDYQVDVDLFIGAKNQHPIDDSHPYIRRDANKCIKCGRCVRICAEVQGPGVLGYIYRGFASYVAPEFGESLSLTTCEACGKCIEVCPVGALLPKNQNYKLNPHPSEIITQNCGLCGTGCKIEIEKQGDRITQIRPATDAGFNGRNLCFYGKFGWQIYDDESRIDETYVRQEQNWQPIPASQATHTMKQKWQEAKSKHIYVSPTSSNEEILMLKKAAENIGATISSLSYKHSFADMLQASEQKTYKDLEEAENIVIVGKISQTLRTLIRTQQRQGKKLIMITDEHKDFNEFADELFDDEPIVNVLEKILEYYYDNEEEEEEKEVINLDLPAKTLFLYSRDHITEEAIWNLWVLASIVCNFEAGSGVLPTSHFANLKGLQKMGIPAGKAAIYDFVLLYGELPCEEQKKLISHSKFIVSMQTHQDDYDISNMLLPIPSYLEVEGTAIANDGQVTYFKNALNSHKLQKTADMLYKAGILKKKDTSLSQYLKQAEIIMQQQPQKKSLTNEELHEFLYSVEEVKLELLKQNNLQKKMMIDYKNRIKSR